MGRLYYKGMYSVFWAALVIDFAIRIYHKLVGIDPITGFYIRGTPLVWVFNGILIVACVLMVLMNRLKMVDGDYPVMSDKSTLGLLSVVVGVCIALYSLEAVGWLFIAGKQSAIVLSGASAWIALITGMLAALSFCVVGFRSIFFGAKTPSVLVGVFPSLWQLLLLVIKYNKYRTVITISDNLLSVLFMCAAALFVVGNARTICRLARKDGRNYLIPTGLVTSMLGILLAVPNLLLLFFNNQPYTVGTIGLFESIYILALSIYSFVCVVRFCRSIAVV